MAGYVRPLLLGCISGIVLFLVFVSWRFSVLDISLGGFMIPIYVPASSFLGALCSIFVYLYYHPSKLDPNVDRKRTREFIAQIFAAIILGLFVYAVTLPTATNVPKASISVFVLFGFASGFYISPMLSFLRKKIFSLIDETLLKEDERKRIIEDIKENPKQYSILSDNEIKNIANKTGMDEKELRELIKEGERKRIIKDIEENPEQYSILSDNEIKNIANKTGMDEKELNEKLRIVKTRK